MEIVSSASHEKASLSTHVWSWFEALPKRLTAEVIETASNTKKLAQDDPRRVTHSIKVGLALSLVSLFYYYQPLYDNFGVSGIWAVMTVVVVFEFSVGATLGKGLNRALATLLAGALGLGAYHLANLSGHIGEPILLGLFVFIQAATSTFVRFFPKIKARYDYGLLIFILTFSMISVSGFRDNKILELAHQRLSTIIIGGSSCIIISILIFPVWAGEDLHNLIALNMEKLANFLEHPSVIEYFKTSENGESNDDKSFLQGCKSVLNSKRNEESLANFARWEPCHGQFHFRHPWKQYLTIGTLTRECAYRIDALSGHLNSDIQPKPEICSKIQVACTTMSLESGKCLRELACGVRAMTHPSSAKPHISKAKIAAKELKLLLKSSLWEQDADLLAVIPSVTVASLLIDIVNCTENIADSVLELASLAHFESVDPTSTVSPEKSQIGQHEPDKPLTEIACPQVVIIVDGSENENPPVPLTNRHIEM
nr:aluminum-activated malate transporter 2-like [Quercus suber]POE90943.1 aluminum-activated malate transporter 2 [Quercus suber]